MAIILFPKLALGLSGFETGVAVMPLVRGDATDTEDAPAGRIRNTKKLLRTAALLMSALLLGSSFVTAVLIPPDAFLPGQPPTAARSPTLRTNASARGSARSTTPARSPFCGLPAHRRSPACSTSSRGTCPDTEWRRNGRARTVRS